MGFKRKEETHELIKENKDNRFYVDKDRDIIVYVERIDEHMNQIRIKKKKKKTGIFEFLWYN